MKTGEFFKEKFYYLKDENGHPRVTVCIIETKTGVVSRGVSLCSYLDLIRKAEGRNKARGRAVQALHNNTNNISIDRSVDSHYILCVVSDIAKDPEILEKFNYLSEINPSLTNLEQRILEGRRSE